MRILSIDPGYERVGIAVIEKLPKQKEVLVYSDCFKTVKEEKLPARIALIGQEIKKLIKEYQPERLAIEKLYFTTNQKTAMGVAEARGVIMYEGSLADLTIHEYTPLEIKVAVTGYGKSDKKQMISMIPRLLKIDKNIAHDDEYDAIAVGITCLAVSRSGSDEILRQ
ncbi:MAG: crossover junction endodeoxyribonuclease RuvC [Patescibacteria group bacterium]